jgi:hypothetical protein
MLYMHDGAPAHVIRVVRDDLSNTYHDRCTGREDSLHDTHACQI